MERKSYGPVGGFIEDHFKLLWNHDPNDGIYYKLRVYKGKKHGGFLQKVKAGTYGYKLYYPSDNVTKTTKVVPNPTNFEYTGVVHNVNPREFTISMSMNYIYAGFIGSIPIGMFISDAQKFEISITGLKPNTYHKFMFDGEDKTSKCSQNRNGTPNTSGLLSDANGSLNFDFYYDAGIDEATTDLEQQNKLAAATAGTKVFTVQSYDGNSKSTGSIGLKYYTAIPPSYYSTSGLNTSQTATMSATTDRPPATPAPAAVSSQAVGDAIDMKNFGTIDWSRINLNLF